jgi:hypothetical protein
MANAQGLRKLTGPSPALPTRPNERRIAPSYLYRVFVSEVIHQHKFIAKTISALFILKRVHAKIVSEFSPPSCLSDLWRLAAYRLL